MVASRKFKMCSLISTMFGEKKMGILKHNKLIDTSESFTMSL